MTMLAEKPQTAANPVPESPADLLADRERRFRAFLKPDQFLIRDDAQPPDRKLRQLLQVNPRFRQSWERQRPDFQEQTSHAYQISLAALALGARWSEQEVVDLLIAWRRRHHREFKSRRAYYQNLIRAGRQPQRRQREREELRALLQEPPQPETAERIRQCLGRQLGCNLHRILRYSGPPAAYSLATDRGLIRLGAPADWSEQHRFQEFFQNQIGVRPAACLDQAWQERKEALLAIAEEAQGQPPERSPDLTVQWLAGYLNQNPPQGEDWLAQAAQAQPFLKDGFRHIFSQPFRDWLTQQGPQLTPHEMGQRLRRLGCLPITVTFSRERQTRDSQRSRQCWRLPADL